MKYDISQKTMPDLKLPLPYPIIIHRVADYDILTLQLTRILVDEIKHIASLMNSDEIDNLWLAMSYNLTEANFKVKLVSLYSNSLNFIFLLKV